MINVPYDPEGPNPFASARNNNRYSIQADATGQPLWGGWANSCGSNCTSQADCKGGAGGNGNCTCLAAQKGTFEPGIGAMAFVAACIVSMAGSKGGGVGGGGKRSLTGEGMGEGEGGWACPCNATYVSRGCCGVGDGLVWEAEEFKLGELVR